MGGPNGQRRAESEVVGRWGRMNGHSAFYPLESTHRNPVLQLAPLWTRRKVRLSPLSP